MNTDKGKYWSKAWSLVESCTPISEGCLNCWLANMDFRFAKGNARCEMDDDRPFFYKPARFREDRLKLPEPPIKRNSKRKYQVWAIWSDFYHPIVTDEQIYKVYNTMRHCQGDTFLILTKRPERLSQLCPKFSSMLPDRLNYVWHGVTCENQQRADERIPYLLQIQGKRFLSLEPLLGEIDMLLPLIKEHQKDTTVHPLTCGVKSSHGLLYPKRIQGNLVLLCLDCGYYQDWVPKVLYQNINQIIIGAESGSHRRPCNIEWIRSIVKQCKEAGIPCFVKQIHDEKGRVVKDINLFPEDLRVRELAWR